MEPQPQPECRRLLLRLAALFTLYGLAIAVAVAFSPELGLVHHAGPALATR